MRTEALLHRGAVTQPSTEVANQSHYECIGQGGHRSQRYWQTPDVNECWQPKGDMSPDRISDDDDGEDDDDDDDDVD